LCVYPPKTSLFLFIYLSRSGTHPCMCSYSNLAQARVLLILLFLKKNTKNEVVACGGDCRCRLWDITMGECVRLFKGHRSPGSSHTPIYVLSSCCYICVLILLYMCPHTPICVLILLSYICVLILLDAPLVVLLEACSAALSRLLCVLILLYMCPHTPLGGLLSCSLSSIGVCGVCLLLSLVYRSMRLSLVYRSMRSMSSWRRALLLSLGCFLVARCLFPPCRVPD